MQQQTYLTLIARGASPAGCCGQLGISLMSVALTAEGDDRFRSLLDRVNQLLSQNIAAALYRSAMKGSVSAQTFYLKNFPPPEWHGQAQEASPDPQDELTEDELIERFRTEAAALLAHLDAENRAQAGAAQS